MAPRDLLRDPKAAWSTLAADGLRPVGRRKGRPPSPPRRLGRSWSQSPRRGGWLRALRAPRPRRRVPMDPTAARLPSSPRSSSHDRLGPARAGHRAGSIPVALSPHLYAPRPGRTDDSGLAQPLCHQLRQGQGAPPDARSEPRLAPSCGGPRSGSSPADASGPGHDHLARRPGQSQVATEREPRASSSRFSLSARGITPRRDIRAVARALTGWVGPSYSPTRFASTRTSTTRETRRCSARQARGAPRMSCGSPVRQPRGGRAHRAGDCFGRWSPTPSSPPPACSSRWPRRCGQDGDVDLAGIELILLSRLFYSTWCRAKRVKGPVELVVGAIRPASGLTRRLTWSSSTAG